MFEQSGYAPALICALLHPQRTSELRISPSFIDDPPLSCWNIRLHESLDCSRSALRLCTNQIDRLTLRCSDNRQESQSLLCSLWNRFSSPPNSSKFRHVYWKTIGKSWVELVSVLCQFVCYCVYMYIVYGGICGDYLFEQLESLGAKTILSDAAARLVKLQSVSGLSRWNPSSW